MKEKAILVYVFKSGEKRQDAEHKLQELESLAETAGATVVSEVIQFREEANPKYLIGEGKLEEIKKKVEEYNADLVIFGTDLFPRHTKNLEEYLNIKVIDRTELIMDIFAQHATSKEAKIQVELAQLLYRLSKLRGMGKLLSRLGGGIGTRGPGEKILEVKRRNIMERIKNLKRELKKIETQRKIQSKRRKNFFKVCLVGYTNAGKTSILNALTKAGAKTEDALFVTLDALTKRFFVNGIQVLLSDTVGFIENLPLHLIHTFKSTLKVIEDADLLLHIVDVSNPRKEAQIESVNEVLYEMGLLGVKEVLYVFNKSDLLLDEEEKFYLKNKYFPSFFVSAKTGENLNKLIDKIGEFALKWKSEIEVKKWTK